MIEHCLIPARILHYLLMKGIEMQKMRLKIRFARFVRSLTQSVSCIILAQAGISLVVEREGSSSEKMASQSAPIVLSVLILMGLSGCSAINDYRATQVYTSGYLKALPEKPQPPLYCYETIGAPMCYPTPIPGAEDRLIDYYSGPPPCPKQKQATTPHISAPEDAKPYPGPRYPDSPIVIRPLKR